jgi:hypothetical protein
MPEKKRTCGMKVTVEDKEIEVDTLDYSKFKLDTAQLKITGFHGKTRGTVRIFYNGTWLALAKLILGVQNGKVVHGNGDRFDMRKENLSPMFKEDNGIVKDRNKFRVMITCFGKRIYLGRFDTLEEAKIARDSKLKQFLCKNEDEEEMVVEG